MQDYSRTWLEKSRKASPRKWFAPGKEELITVGVVWAKGRVSQVQRISLTKASPGIRGGNFADDALKGECGCHVGVHKDHRVIEC